MGAGDELSEPVPGINRASPSRITACGSRFCPPGIAHLENRSTLRQHIHAAFRDQCA